MPFKIVVFAEKTLSVTGDGPDGPLLAQLIHDDEIDSSLSAAASTKKQNVSTSAALFTFSPLYVRHQTDTKGDINSSTGNRSSSVRRVVLKKEMLDSNSTAALLKEEEVGVTGAAGRRISSVLPAGICMEQGTVRADQRYVRCVEMQGSYLFMSYRQQFQFSGGIVEPQAQLCFNGDRYAKGKEYGRDGLLVATDSDTTRPELVLELEKNPQGPRTRSIRVRAPSDWVAHHFKKGTSTTTKISDGEIEHTDLTRMLVGFDDSYPNSFDCFINDDPPTSVNKIFIGSRITTTNPSVYTQQHGASTTDLIVGATFCMRSYYAGLLQQSFKSISVEEGKTRELRNVVFSQEELKSTRPPASTAIAFQKVNPFFTASQCNQETYIIYFPRGKTSSGQVETLPLYLGVSPEGGGNHHQIECFTSVFMDDMTYHFEVRHAPDVFPKVPDTLGLFTIYHPQTERYLAVGKLSDSAQNSITIVERPQVKNPSTLSLSEIVEFHHLFFELLPYSFKDLTPRPAGNTCPSS